MFLANVPAYVIDLANDEGLRWAEVAARETDIAGKLLQETGAEFERVPELVRSVFASLYRAFGGLYRGELESWAKALGASVGTITMLNCAYELSHLRWPKLFGCTAGVRWVDGLGMVHVRNMDWPLDTLGAGTRLFRFRRGARRVRLRRRPCAGRRALGHVVGSLFRHDQLGPARGFPFVQFRAGVPAARHVGGVRQLRLGRSCPHGDPAFDERVLHGVRYREGPGLRHRANAAPGRRSLHDWVCVGSSESPRCWTVRGKQRGSSRSKEG